jgi:hypothetical protein
MTPALLLAQLPNVASSIGLPVGNATLAAWVQYVVDRLAGAFGTGSMAAVTSFDVAVMEAFRAAYVASLLFGTLVSIPRSRRRRLRSLLRLCKVVAEQRDYPSERGDLLPRLK